MLPRLLGDSLLAAPLSDEGDNSPELSIKPMALLDTAEDPGRIVVLPKATPAPPPPDPKFVVEPNPAPA